MTTEYLKNSDNKVYSFDRELNPQELIGFQNGDLEGVFVKDFSSDENAIDVGAILNNDIVFGLKLTKTFLEMIQIHLCHASLHGLQAQIF